MSSAEPQDKKETSEIVELAQQCLDSPGYLFFVARISKNRDAEDRAIIDFNYKRYHFALEDARQAIRELQKFVKEELARLAEPEEEPAG